MRCFLGPAAVVLLLASAPARADIAITVDKDSQQMTVKVDGEVRYRWPVSTGTPRAETPNGTHRAFRLEPDHYSKEFDDAPMPHSIFFTKRGHAIHGTFSEKQLGVPVSNGCVRLSRDNAATLFKLVEAHGVLKTTVTLTGSSRVALARRGKPAKKTAVAARNATPEFDADGRLIAAPRAAARPVYAARPGRQRHARDDAMDAPGFGETWHARRIRRMQEAQAYDDAGYGYAPRRAYAAPPVYAQPPAYAPPPGYYGGRGLFTSGW